MQLGRLIPHVTRSKPLGRPVSSNNKLETGRGIFRTGKDLYSGKNYQYYVLVIDLIDNAILTDNLHALSQEQQKLIEKFFSEAKTPTDGWESSGNVYNSKYDENRVTPKDVLEFYDGYNFTDFIKELDDFLGGYLGVDNGEYSRYGTEQLHSKRKPFGKEYSTVRGA